MHSCWKRTDRWGRSKVTRCYPIKNVPQQLGEWLVRRSVISRCQLFDGLVLVGRHRCRIGDALVWLGHIERLRLEQEARQFEAFANRSAAVNI